MKVIICPEVLPPEDFSTSIFLAGGIVGCADWQSEMIELLKDQDVTLFNPRRPSFPIHDRNAAPQQIKWEFDALRKADQVLFWFDSGTVQPIVMFEYGWWLNEASNYEARIFVGVHPDYPRKLDVFHQTALVQKKSVALSNLTIANSLESLANQIIAEERKGSVK